MLDIKLIRKEPNEIEKKLKTKIKDISISQIISIDTEIRKTKTLVEEKKAKRNVNSKLIGEKKQKKEDASDLIKSMNDLREEITSLDNDLKEKEEKLNYMLAMLPNLPMEGIPVSLDPKDNKCIKTHLEKRVFDFEFKNHVELNEKLNLFDFSRASKIAGSNFVLYKGMGAKLEWALLNYMLDIHTQNGYTQIIPPILAKEEMMFGSAQLPKFKDQSYKIQDDDFLFYLIPTAEVALNAIHFDEILEESSLPLRYVSYTPCFRREAGAYGSNERGLIRTHQFNKVELFSLTKPEDSEEIFNHMLNSAEEILQGLELHYKSMLLCTGDMSFASAKTIDIEVFLPGQNRYYEVSSVSNCTDFQARRSQIRYRDKDKKLTLIHTLNASGVATSRLMVALLENNQQKDGSIVIPKVLRKYLNNIEILEPNK
ncbi:MAG: Serine--tRNA ligase [Candidatus Anoxychlamydiales bacterium]|nr:Serine--tRNA ligase [Candidatus Anoxychlamydiales bacterium]